MQQPWIMNLRVGDKVIVAGQGMDRNSRTIEVVTKLTPHRVTTKNRVFKTDGSQVSDSKWDTVGLEEATPERLAEVRAEVKRRRQLGFLQQQDWSKRSEAELDEIVGILLRTPK